MKHTFANVGKEQIWESSSEKLLGVIINNSLNFRQHIENICKKANRKLTALIRLRDGSKEVMAGSLLTNVEH